MVSIVEIILAVSAGLRNAGQVPMWPFRTRSVRAASADSDVNDSKVISSVGRGTVWTWSNNQIDSKPRRSASSATSVVRRHASSGSQPSYSPTQPWGTTAPIFIRFLLVTRTVRRPRGRWGTLVMQMDDHTDDAADPQPEPARGVLERIRS